MRVRQGRGSEGRRTGVFTFPMLESPMIWARSLRHKVGQHLAADQLLEVEVGELDRVLVRDRVEHRVRLAAPLVLREPLLDEVLLDRVREERGAQHVARLLVPAAAVVRRRIQSCMTRKRSLSFIVPPGTFGGGLYCRGCVLPEGSELDAQLVQFLGELLGEICDVSVEVPIPRVIARPISSRRERQVALGRRL